MRFRLSDLILFILVFVFVIAFPVDLIPLNQMGRLLVQLGLRLLLLAFYIYIIVKYRIKVFGIANIKNLLLCLPFFLISASNFTAAAIQGGFDGQQFSESLLAIEIAFTLVTAITEEIIFRLFIHNALVTTSSIKRIFGSALIFALMHLINIVNVRYVSGLITVLVQTVYTFGLGLLLGVLYEYSHSLTGAVLLHFCFNLFNTDIFSFYGGYSSDLVFYLTAVGYAVVIGGYAAIITIFYFRNHDLYFRR